jgi:hypothetical protein
MNFHRLDIASNKTSAGKEGDVISTQCVYKCIDTFHATFLAEIDVILASSNKDMYTPNKADFVNCASSSTFLVVNQTFPTMIHVSKTLMFRQCTLSDASMDALGEILWKGSMREDPWIKQFIKDMLVKVASSEEVQLRDLHAKMDHQTSWSEQLHLVDCFL